MTALRMYVKDNAYCPNKTVTEKRGWIQPFFSEKNRFIPAENGPDAAVRYPAGELPRGERSCRFFSGSLQECGALLSTEDKETLS